MTAFLFTSLEEYEKVSLTDSIDFWRITISNLINFYSAAYETPTNADRIVYQVMITLPLASPADGTNTRGL